VDLILASGSTTRRQILAEAGVPFRVIPADIDEAAERDKIMGWRKQAEDVALELAQLKAVQVSRHHSEAWVLGADQTLLFGDELIVKSDDLHAARILLRRLRGRTHRLVTCLALTQGGIIFWSHRAVASLSMRDFSDVFLEDYVAREGEAILSSVGCYRLESLGSQLFEKIEGDYFSILGLPLLPLLAELRKQGILPS
jgi:septum formation protein